MGVLLNFSVAGEEQIKRLLNVHIERNADLSPAFEAIGKRFREMMAEQFESEGSRGGLPWSVDYSKAYAAYKRAALGSVHPALYLTGKLMASMTRKNAAGNIHEVGPRDFKFGSAIPYARVHHSGLRGNKVRKVIALTNTDKREIVQIVQRYIKTGEA